MKEIYPDYADDVEFYAVGLHPGLKEEMAVLKAYKEQNGYPWVVATAPKELMADLGVTIQSTKSPLILTEQLLTAKVWALAMTKLGVGYLQNSPSQGRSAARGHKVSSNITSPNLVASAKVT